MQTLLTLPKDFLATYEAVSALPPYDPSTASQLSVPLADPGKRPWETSKTGYVNWAVAQLVARSKDGEQGSGSAAVGPVVDAAYRIAKAEDMKAVTELVAGTSHKLPRDEDAMDES